MFMLASLVCESEIVMLWNVKSWGGGGSCNYILFLSEVVNFIFSTCLVLTIYQSMFKYSLGQAACRHGLLYFHRVPNGIINKHPHLLKWFDIEGFEWQLTLSSIQP